MSGGYNETMKGVKAMNRIKFSNRIFDLKLSTSEFAVYAYLCSLPSKYPMLDGTYATKVKQSTIARNCGIKAVQTVSKVIASLAEKSLVEPVRRSVHRDNGYKGTYLYTVKKLPTNDNFFFVPRSIFGKLIPRQMMIYFFMCKSYSTQLCDCWNSYSDISQQTGMKRETVIQTVAELEEMNLIRKSRRKSKSNKRVYVDNHYIVILYIPRRLLEKGKKIIRLHWECNRTINNNIKMPNLYINSSTFKSFCQDLNEKIFLSRGSPQI